MPEIEKIESVGKGEYKIFSTEKVSEQSLRNLLGQMKRRKEELDILSPLLQKNISAIRLVLPKHPPRPAEIKK